MDEYLNPEMIIVAVDGAPGTARALSWAIRTDVMDVRSLL